MKIKAEVDLDNFWTEFSDTYTYEISQELKTALKKDALSQLKASPEYKKVVKKIQETMLDNLVKGTK